ncbi:hypothetical protein KAM448_21080 [Aeromonas caviae]|uniref:Uncharacterized protein n=1 Tax=Aeromonas caviae TaxID=648 RepID=A0ABD0BAT9_AERCA|nr:hypothetical protein KAM376_25380 [Aeromonas caviae]GJA83118.1 hypothetical protein KAM355_36780 [Aeromonas caviae]GJB00664.1 hypothetical protein KAM359_40710 [Aeromonas caviae]GJB12773.1 hypothetical protein KAM362_33330 [Aeromonas caviae]GJB25410.1 hypothetical protein KAM365_31600 [Aeromonas caviae]
MGQIEGAVARSGGGTEQGRPGHEAKESRHGGISWQASGIEASSAKGSRLFVILMSGPPRALRQT